MFTSFKGRSVFVGQKVRVYRNLHKPGVIYSVADARSGLVLGYADNVLLSAPSFKVSEYGRQRVLETGRKNVHAFVYGWYEGDIPARVAMQEVVTYNPLKYTSFVRKFDETPIVSARLAHVGPEGVAVA